MDVHCTTCGEPWDVYHLRYDAIFETNLSHAEAKAWTTLSPQLKLLPRYREKFKASGFEFGGSIVNVLRCPATVRFKAHASTSPRIPCSFRKSRKSLPRWFRLSGRLAFI